MSRLSAFAVILLLTGCVVGPRYRAPTTTVPAHWSEDQGNPKSAAALQDFWAGFEDPTLLRLIRQGIQKNYDLKSAGERIRAAYDLVRVAAAGSLPQIGIGTAAENRRQTQTLDWPPPSRYGDYPYYAVGFDASWELDLFGQVKRQKESAQAAAGAAVETRRGILVSLTAAVASTYLSLRATELHLQIARANLDVARQAQRLARHAFKSGERSHLDVSEADGQVHAIEATIPSLQAQSEELIHALAILLGQAPASFTNPDLHRDRAIPNPPPLPPSLPSEVIAQRPDIRRAERDYAQASANVGVAVAALYPHFSIPLGMSSTGSMIREVFQHASLLWRAGLDGTQSLYTGGRLTASVDAARADREAALFSYRQTVLRAFAEVEDALSRQRAERLRYQAITAELADDRRAVLEAQERYREGEVSLRPVLRTEEVLYATEDAHLASRLNRCLIDISLFKALGGSWQDVALPNVAAVRSESN
jgi:NodT family efflux transporter outer membrane factor (OMF) lipoprotein